MKVRLYATGAGPRDEPPRTVAGETALGPDGFIEALEERLGLPAVLAGHADRLVTFERCLAEADRADRFYHASFAVDPVNVARTLLDWRARWYEAGWTGALPTGAPKRLADLGEVEDLARGRVPPTRGERLGRIAAALEAGARTGIESVELTMPSGELPRAWGRVLEHLPVVVPTPASPGAAPGTDLGRLQRRLTGDDRGRTPLPLAGDGSLLAVRAVSRDVSAQAIAEYVRAQPPGQTVLIAERDGIILDNALERVGLPRAGFQHWSALRGVTEVLKLALGLLWSPLGARALLQFLIHPIGPLPRRVRFRLAESVAAAPGVGGPAWRDVCDGLDAPERTAVTAWLESPRFDPRAGAPAAAVIAVVTRVVSWIAGAMATVARHDERALYAAALGQARALGRALLDSPLDRIERGRLDVLLAEVAGDAPDPGSRAEAGHVRASASPGAVGNAEEVIWWDLRPGSAEPACPWSRGELAALRAAGIVLPDLAELLAARRRQWLTPVLRARRRLLLVLHERDVRGHLLWHLVASTCERVPDADLDRALLDGLVSEVAPGIATRVLLPRRLPARRDAWRLPADAPIAPREVESFSSLARLIHHPHQWVLDHAAGLRPGRATDLATGPLLYGELAHRLIERFFAEQSAWRSLTDDRVDAWLEATLPALMTESGAVLLERGAGVEHERVVARLERALPALLTHLRAADVVEVRAELALAAVVDGERLSGSIDLCVERADGRSAVVDLKWGGEAYRARLLAANRHLQLAVYAALVRAATGSSRWPDCAFFVISSAKLLARDRSFFPDATVPALASGESLPDLWRRAGITLDWRRRQLAAGHVAIGGAGGAADAGVPATGLAPDEDPDRFEVYGALLGWDRHA